LVEEAKNMTTTDIEHKLAVPIGTARGRASIDQGREWPIAGVRLDGTGFFTACDNQQRFQTLELGQNRGWLVNAVADRCNRLLVVAQHGIGFNNTSSGQVTWLLPLDSQFQDLSEVLIGAHACPTGGLICIKSKTGSAKQQILHIISRHETRVIECPYNVKGQFCWIVTNGKPSHLALIEKNGRSLVLLEYNVDKNKFGEAQQVSLFPTDGEEIMDVASDSTGAIWLAFKAENSYLARYIAPAVHCTIDAHVPLVSSPCALVFSGVNGQAFVTYDRDSTLRGAVEELDLAALTEREFKGLAPYKVNL
jgi:hypothetical protein